MDVKMTPTSSMGMPTEEHLTGTETDATLHDTDTTDSDTVSDDATVDPSRLEKENPFLPPPPPYELSNESGTTQQGSSNTGLGCPQPQSQPPSVSRRLEQLIAIPALSHKLGSPFLRAYPPCLEAYEISRDTFLKVIDDLNQATVRSPPFRVLGLAGMITGYVTIGTVPLVGQATQAIAKAGATTVSKARTESLIQEANRTIFLPRGLRCEIAKLNAVAKIANIPILDQKGNVTKPGRFFPDLESNKKDVQRTNDGVVILYQQRLDALKGYIAPVELNGLPDVATPDSAMGRWNAEASEKDRRRAEKRLAKQANRASKTLPADERIAKHYDKVMSKGQRKLEKVIAEEGADSKKAQKEIEKLDRKQTKLDSRYEKRLTKAEKRDEKETKKEKRIKKVLWVIIRDLHAEV